MSPEQALYPWVMRGERVAIKAEGGACLGAKFHDSYVMNADYSQYFEHGAEEHAYKIVERSSGKIAHVKRGLCCRRLLICLGLELPPIGGLI